jgi:hypothetical protein
MDAKFKSKRLDPFKKNSYLFSLSGRVWLQSWKKVLVRAKKTNEKIVKNLL